jgi:hypothetical protein
MSKSIRMARTFRNRNDATRRKYVARIMKHVSPAKRLNRIDGG